VRPHDTRSSFRVAKRSGRHGVPSWRIANDVVEGWLTRDGGQLAPVYFKTTRGRVQPFSIAPWRASALPPKAPRVLRHLRGDFFCLPFGLGDRPWHGERYPLHGETSGNRWDLVHVERTGDTTELVASMRTMAPAGTVTKRIMLKSGQTVLYCSHEIEGVSGPMCFGHHAMLRLPDRRNAGHLAFSPIRFGQVRPSDSIAPSLLERWSLKPGATFRDLHQVPLARGGYEDLTRFPARSKSDDLVLVVSRPTIALAWSTVTLPAERYLWFSLKKPKQLAATLLWYSNGGFQSPPWNGRHRPVLGIEEITALFDFGLAASANPNCLSQRGVPTTLNFRKNVKTRISYVMGVTELPRKFHNVSKVIFGRDLVSFISETGAIARQAVDLSFLSKD